MHTYIYIYIYTYTLILTNTTIRVIQDYQQSGQLEELLAGLGRVLNKAKRLDLLPYVRRFVHNEDLFAFDAECAVWLATSTARLGPAPPAYAALPPRPPLTIELRPRRDVGLGFSACPVEGGLAVATVTAQSEAERAGLRPRDLILAVNDRRVWLRSDKEITKASEKLLKGRAVKLLIRPACVVPIPQDSIYAQPGAATSSSQTHDRTSTLSSFPTYSIGRESTFMSTSGPSKRASLSVLQVLDSHDPVGVPMHPVYQPQGSEVKEPCGKAGRRPLSLLSNSSNINPTVKLSKGQAGESLSRIVASGAAKQPKFSISSSQSTGFTGQGWVGDDGALRKVSLHVEGSLGIGIIGGSDQGRPIRICSVEPGSAADLAGLRAGEFIVDVNGESFEHICHLDAVRIIQNNVLLVMTIRSSIQQQQEQQQQQQQQQQRRVLSPRRQHSSVGLGADGVTVRPPPQCPRFGPATAATNTQHAAVQNRSSRSAYDDWMLSPKRNRDSAMQDLSCTQDPTSRRLFLSDEKEEPNTAPVPAPRPASRLAVGSGVPGKVAATESSSVGIGGAKIACRPPVTAAWMSTVSTLPQTQSLPADIDVTKSSNPSQTEHIDSKAPPPPIFTRIFATDLQASSTADAPQPFELPWSIDTSPKRRRVLGLGPHMLRRSRFPQAQGRAHAMLSLPTKDARPVRPMERQVCLKTRKRLNTPLLRASSCFYFYLSL